mmetsp:Transcript_17124/g.47039  ORF Transcript_17124/g.47039 Transcript_17124/m.47039 type:complete len:113 (+) Transcript_17124:187-525(+)
MSSNFPQASAMPATSNFYGSVATVDTAPLRPSFRRDSFLYSRSFGTVPSTPVTSALESGEEEQYREFKKSTPIANRRCAYTNKAFGSEKTAISQGEIPKGKWFRDRKTEAVS